VADIQHQTADTKPQQTWRGSILSDFNQALKALQTQTMWPEKATPSEDQPHSEDRRTGIDRRRFSYTDHVPDKRTGIDRRKMVGG
jgi:hypothetical protein